MTESELLTNDHPLGSGNRLIRGELLRFSAVRGAQPLAEIVIGGVPTAFPVNRDYDLLGALAGAVGQSIVADFGEIQWHVHDEEQSPDPEWLLIDFWTECVCADWLPDDSGACAAEIDTVLASSRAVMRRESISGMCDVLYALKEQANLCVDALSGDARDQLAWERVRADLSTPFAYGATRHRR